jgi:hypothetical protein
MTISLSLKQIYDVKDDLNSMYNLLYQLDKQVQNLRQIINQNN